VPAERFHFQPVDLIGLSGGDEQNMVSGLSSFGGEMQRIAHLLKQKGTALLLLDEVARTTNPEEGEALAIGLASFLVDSSHTAVMASHFTGVTQVAGIQGFRVAGLRTDVLAELEQSGTTGDVLQRLQSAMDYRLVKSDGGEVPKHAVRLAKCFGLPEQVLEKARHVLQQDVKNRGEGLAQ
ncbi:MAG: MutS-related protein, partial [Tumebacillaceae bacterium]